MNLTEGYVHIYINAQPHEERLLQANKEEMLLKELVFLNIYHDKIAFFKIK